MSQLDSNPKSIFTERTFMVIIVVVLLGMFLSQGRDRPSDGGDGSHDLAPEFTLPQPGGEDVSLKNYRGKWVLLHFWATWCETCVAETPSLTRMAKLMGDRPFQVIAVHAGKESDEAILAWREKYGLDYPTPVDAEEETIRSYGVARLPASYLINPKGEISAMSLGAREWDDPKMVSYVLGKINSAKKRKAAK